MECNEVLAVLVGTENAWVVTGWPFAADEVGGMIVSTAFVALWD